MSSTIDTSALPWAGALALKLALGTRARRGCLLLDWVPNHTGIASGENPWWDDVLENGPRSAFADHFDIDWSAPKQGLTDRGFSNSRAPSRPRQSRTPRFTDTTGSCVSTRSGTTLDGLAAASKSFMHRTRSAPGLGRSGW